MPREKGKTHEVHRQASDKPDERAVDRREGHVRGRCPAPGHDLYRDPPQPACARADPLDRHVAGRRRARASSAWSRARNRREHEPDPRGLRHREIGAKGVEWYSLCPDRARYVGEAVAAVVAEDQFTAYAALDLIDVDYEESCPRSSTPWRRWSRIRRSSSPSGATTCIATRDFEHGDPDAAFARGRRRRQRDRPVEPHHRRAARAAGLRRLLRPLCQTCSRSGTRPRTRTRCGPSWPRRCGCTETAIRVIQPHVGGGFGLKQPTFQEEPLVAYLRASSGGPSSGSRSAPRTSSPTGMRATRASTTRPPSRPTARSPGIDLRGDRRRRRADGPLRLGHVLRHRYCLPTRLQDPERPRCSSARRHEQVPVERVPRLRQGRRVVPDGPDHGSRREADRRRPRRGPAAQLHPARRVPVSRSLRARCSTAATTRGAAKRASRWSTTTSFAKLQEEARKEGRRIGLGIGQELTPEGCAMPGSLMLCGYDGTDGAGHARGRRHRPDRRHLARLRQRDGDRADRGRRPRLRARADPGGPGRHRDLPVRPRQLQLPEHHHRRLGRARGRRRAPREADAGRRQHARGRAGGPRRARTGGSSSRAPRAGRSPSRTSSTEIYRHPFGTNMDDSSRGSRRRATSGSANIYHQPEKQGRFSNYPTWPYGVGRVRRRGRPGHRPRRRSSATARRRRRARSSTRCSPTPTCTARSRRASAERMYEQIVYDEAGQLLTATLMDYTIPTAVEVPTSRSATRRPRRRSRRSARRAPANRASAAARGALQRDRERVPGARPAADRAAAHARARLEGDPGRQANVARARGRVLMLPRSSTSSRPTARRGARPAEERRAARRSSRAG